MTASAARSRVRPDRAGAGLARAPAGVGIGRNRLGRRWRRLALGASVEFYAQYEHIWVVQNPASPGPASRHRGYYSQHEQNKSNTAFRGPLGATAIKSSCLLAEI